MEKVPTFLVQMLQARAKAKIQHTYPRGIHSFISELSGSQTRLEWDCVAKMVMPRRFTGQEKTINGGPMR